MKPALPLLAYLLGTAAAPPPVRRPPRPPR
jgi:hypothetical protein